jgi:hypothetical protein
MRVPCTQEATSDSSREMTTKKTTMMKTFKNEVDEKTWKTTPRSHSDVRAACSNPHGFRAAAQP